MDEDGPKDVMGRFGFTNLTLEVLSLLLRCNDDDC